MLIVDDQHLVRSGFTMMLSVEDDIEVVGDVANGELAVAAARELRPDVILMDVQMPVMDGIEATRVVVGADLGRVVILTTFDRDDYLFDALRAGASGFLLKNAEPEQLVDAVRSVAGGHALLAPEVTTRVIAAMVTQGGATTPATATSHVGSAEQLDRLTEREREVLVLMAQGKSNGEIARELFLGEATVKTHVSNCLAKLHLRDRVQAVVFAYEVGLIRPAETRTHPRG
ncbi:LuxR family transcriptional regulator [Knoellia flava TL1]|uniref:DNA-binding response regulator n=2 Tax=Knoellia flava TaxID=913969 RepID=A0A8H9FTH0_9MICO|nr:LuxR family transcriptional regulator [Knoellia flava TL1]GGB77775.1 DNA-binding response regulator [Knoellia flava]